LCVPRVLSVDNGKEPNGSACWKTSSSCRQNRGSRVTLMSKKNTAEGGGERNTNAGARIQIISAITGKKGPLVVASQKHEATRNNGSGARARRQKSRAGLKVTRTSYRKRRSLRQERGNAQRSISGESKDEERPTAGQLFPKGGGGKKKEGQAHTTAIPQFPGKVLGEGLGTEGRKPTERLRGMPCGRGVLTCAEGKNRNFLAQRGTATEEMAGKGSWGEK